METYQICPHSQKKRHQNVLQRGLFGSKETVPLKTHFDSFFPRCIYKGIIGHEIRLLKLLDCAATGLSEAHDILQPHV